MKIKYNSRIAGTAVYWDMTKEDQSFIMRQLEQLQIEVNERSISRNTDDQNLVEYWNTANKELGWAPRHNRQNTAASLVGGVLRNMRLGRTRDLTDKNCWKIATVFEDIVSGQRKQLFPDMRIQTVEFEEYGRARAPTVMESLFVSE
jgi:hypothetical protein